LVFDNDGFALFSGILKHQRKRGEQTPRRKFIVSGCRYEGATGVPALAVLG
jgi:hypothetical protein